MTNLQPRKIRNVWLVPYCNDYGTPYCWEAIKCDQWTCSTPMSEECECWMEESQPDETFDTLTQAKAWVDAQWRSDAALRSVMSLIQ